MLLFTFKSFIHLELKLLFCCEVELQFNFLPYGYPVMQVPLIEYSRFDSLVAKFPRRRDGLPTPVLLGFPGVSGSKESACSVGDLGLISGLGRSPGGGHGSPLQVLAWRIPCGPRSLVGYSPWGPKESDRTERLSTSFPQRATRTAMSNFNSICE